MIPPNSPVTSVPHITGSHQAWATINSRSTLWKLICNIPQSHTTAQHSLNMIIIVMRTCNIICCMEVCAFPDSVHWRESGNHNAFQRDWIQTVPLLGLGSPRASISSGSTPTHIVSESPPTTQIYTLGSTAGRQKEKLQIMVWWTTGIWSA